jgi:peptidoglycan/xylan/chitin deacetylase (PgdA/CDA1 family)
MPTRRFLDQIDFLTDRGFSFIGEREFLERVVKPRPENANKILITFDDGYEAVHRVFLEHLVPRGVPVLVFLVTDYLGRDNSWELSLGRRPFRLLDAGQVKAMAACGASFGSHGASHRDLTRMSADDLADEMRRSAAVVHGLTGIQPRSFSYPFGRYNDAVKAATKGAGYEAAFSLYPKHPNAIVDLHALRRSGVYIIDSNRSLVRKLQPGPFFWLEEMKCRLINGVAVVTPIVRQLAGGLDK